MKNRTVFQRIKVLAAASMTAAALAGCAQKEGQADPAKTGQEAQTETGQETEAAKQDGEPAGGGMLLDTLHTEEYVSVAEYKGIQVAEPQPQVSQEEKASYIDYLLSMNPPEGVEDGDTVVIDYVGTKDGVAFEGGTASGAYLTIGSGQFIDGFESGLIGAKTGDTVELNLTFPEDYKTEELAGEEVVFTVTVNTIRAAEPQELTDEFVRGLGLEECSSIAEFDEYVYNILYEQAVAAYEDNVKNAIVTVLMDSSQFKKDPPQDMTDRYAKTLTYNLTLQAESNGMSLSDFMMMFYGMDEETYLAEIQSMAKMSAQQYIMMQAIANQEGLNISEGELDSQIQKLAEESGYGSAEEYRAQLDVEDYKEYLMGQKVLDFLMENAVITEPAEEAVTVAEEQATAAEEQTTE